MLSNKIYPYRISYKISSITYKVVTYDAPKYLSSTLAKTTISGRAPLRSSCHPMFLVSRSHSVRFGNRSFYVSGPRTWNALPVHIRTAPTPELFGGQLIFLTYFLISATLNKITLAYFLCFIHMFLILINIILFCIYLFTWFFFIRLPSLVCYIVIWHPRIYICTRHFNYWLIEFIKLDYWFVKVQRFGVCLLYLKCSLTIKANSRADYFLICRESNDCHLNQYITLQIISLITCYC